MKQLIHLGSFLILLAALPVLAADAGRGEVRKVEIFPVNGEVRVEVTLSSAVTPSVETAQHPDRLVLKFPRTTSDSRQRRILVNQFGVRSVRFGLNRPDPPETHLVVDLDQAHSYKVSTDGAKVILIIDEPLSASGRRRTGPAAAASKPLISSLGRGATSAGQPGSQTNQAPVLLTPPPSGPPVTFPAPPANPDSARTTASAGQPSASHPNRASLQEGTVFPNEGAPGAGIVPPVSQEVRPSGLNSNEASLNPSVRPGPQPALSQQPNVAATSSPQTVIPVPFESVAALLPSAPQKVAQDFSRYIPLPSAQKPLEPAPANSGQAIAQASIPANGKDLGARAPDQSIVRESDSTTPEPKVAQDSTPAMARNSGQLPAEASQPATAEISNQKLPADSGQNASEVSADSAVGSGQGQITFVAHQGENSDFRTAFRVKYVAQDAAYLDGGRAAGLTEGMKLMVRDLPLAGAVAAEGADGRAAGDVAELEVLSVAETSAVTEIHLPKRPVKVGDLAYLSSADQQALVQKNALSATRKYPAVVSFTESDTLDDEARAEVPKPPLPSVNRAKGRIGFDYIGVIDHGGSGMVSSNLGMVMRADITRINGTYWNVSGYWRGRFNSTSGGTQTLQDLINRTYHLYTSYDNPTSSWVAGFGRMYLPWASSLDTIDGGYFGRKLKPGVTTGLFLGSTPDPTSYSYNPNREIGGAFVNFEGGSYDDLHYTSTIGGGLNLLKWSVDRPFVFVENGIFYKRVFSIYQASQIDNRQGYWYLDPTKNTNVWQPGTGWGPGRSFTTIRFQPHPRVEFSLNHTYFRDLPTFDLNLAGTGLLDKYLFQGFSGGTRVEVLKQIWLSADLGLSNRSGDKSKSLNQMFGITFGRLPWIGLHADARYTRFNSGFGSGSYEALSFSKNLGEALQLQFLAGQQNFSSTLTSATRSRFVNGMIETALGEHYFIQGGGTISRGETMSYDQFMFTFGYRFDNRHGHRGQ